MGILPNSTGMVPQWSSTEIVQMVLVGCIVFIIIIVVVIILIIIITVIIKWGDILFLDLLSVCPSVHPSLCLLVTLLCRSVSFESLVGLTKNCTNVKSDNSMCSVYI